MKPCPFCAEEIQEAAIRCRYCASDLAAGPPAPPGEPPPSLAMPLPRTAGEKVYYSDPAITVTSTRAVLGARTYAMANITSVSLGENQKWAGCGCALLAVGSLLAVGVVTADTMGAGVIGIVMLVVAFMMMSQKSYVVRIGSASGEANALEHESKEYIQAIVDAMNQAIIERR